MENVFFNEDLMRSIVSYIVDDEGCYVTSPILPIAMTFRIIHDKSFAERHKFLGKDVHFVSMLKHFVESISLVKYAAAMGYNISQNGSICRLAAQGGFLEVLEWASGPEQMLPMPSDMWSKAAYNGHIHVLEWGRRQGHAMDMQLEKISDSAAAGGQIATLNWLVAQGYEIHGAEICSTAARFDRVEVLVWMSGRGNFREESSSCYALSARSGSMNVLQWLFESGVQCDQRGDLCHEAILGANFDVLRYLLGRHLQRPPSQHTIALAARHGRLDMLQLLRSHRCPWNEQVCVVAAGNGHFHTHRLFVRIINNGNQKSIFYGYCNTNVYCFVYSNFISKPTTINFRMFY